MAKKGQSISINTIIVAAIALAVLVVLFAIFTGRMGSFSRGVSETDTCAQKCSSLNMQKVDTVKGADPNPGANCVSPNRYIPGTYGDIATVNVCCCRP
ncbi:hypothetical protein HYW99_02315 [Candidatus Woesearchaeota archaeon]|nr:hypothetical protein [Candidatus Woesearchaeota archaeon]